MTTQNGSTSPATPTQSPTRLSLGQVAYEAYGEKPGPGGPWTTFNGGAMPRWDELAGEPGALTRSRWEEGVAAALTEHARRQLPLDWAERQRRMLDRLRGYRSFVVSPGEMPGTVCVSDSSSRRPVVVPVDLLEMADRRWHGAGATQVVWAVLGGAAATEGMSTGLDEEPVQDEQVDPFLAGLAEISSATRDLAEAKHFLSMTRENKVSAGAVDALIDEVTAQLLARVKQLAQPDTEDAPPEA